MLTGGCLCGDVRYEAHGAPFHSTLCHCSMCRRAAGAPVVAWFSVRRDQMRVTAGRMTRYRSSDRAQRGFCARCGTALTYESDALDEVDITTASLDDPGAMPPQDHVHAATRVGWLRVNEELPAFAEGRGG